MNELDPATLKRDQWIYWTVNSRVFQGQFGSVDGDEIWLYLGLCELRVVYPLKDVKLYKDYPGEAHFRLYRTVDGTIDERVG